MWLCPPKEKCHAALRFFLCAWSAVMKGCGQILLLRLGVPPIPLDL